MAKPASRRKPVPRRNVAPTPPALSLPLTLAPLQLVQLTEALAQHGIDTADRAVLLDKIVTILGATQG